MNEPSLPFPEGPPTEEAHFHIVTDCTKPASHLYQGTVDNAIVHLFFASKSNVHRGSSLIPAKCPELFDIVSLIPLSHSRFYSWILDECTYWTTSHAYWQESSHRNRTKWLSHLSDDQWRPLREIVSSPLFDRTTLRYLAFLKSSRVRVAAVNFSGEPRRQAGIISTRPIPKDTYLWELNGLLSLDTVTDSTISTIMPHAIQGLELAPRLMTGPARFVNHCCRPNAELFPLPSRPVFVIRVVEDIDANSEITVDYGPTFWGTGACLCYVCSPTPPIFSTSRPGSFLTIEDAPAAQTPFAYHFSVVETHAEIKNKRSVKQPLDEELLYTHFCRVTGTRFPGKNITGIRRSIIPAGRYGLFVYHVCLDSDTETFYRSNPARFLNSTMEKYWYTIAGEGTTSSCGWNAFPIDPVHQKAINAMRCLANRGPIEWPGASEIVETSVPSETSPILIRNVTSSPKDDDDDSDEDEFFTPLTTILELE